MSFLNDELLNKVIFVYATTLFHITRVLLLSPAVCVVVVGSIGHLQWTFLEIISKFTHGVVP